jgi:hypothetical protein
MAFGIQNSDYVSGDGGPYLIDNNYIDGLGEGFYFDPQASQYTNANLTYTHNHNIWPKTYFYNDPDNQWRYEVRQHWEVKRLLSGKISGNWFSNYWAFQNDGPAIFLSGRPTYSVNPTGKDGVQDALIESNIMSHGRAGIDCNSANGITGAFADQLANPQAGLRVKINNNLMYDLGGKYYCDFIKCPSAVSSILTMTPACGDMQITNNTLGAIRAGNTVSFDDKPVVMWTGGGENLPNYLKMNNNIFYLSKNTSNEGGVFHQWLQYAGTGYEGVHNHEASPAPLTAVTYGTSPNFKAVFDSYWTQTSSSVAANYSWTGNVVIGGYKEATSTIASTDLSDAETATYATNMPGIGSDSYPTSSLANPDSVLGREQTVGFANTANWDFRIASGPYVGKGVDFAKLYSDQGRVYNIIVTPTSDGAVFTYTAPDSKACYVDVSSTRWTDSGGATSRTLTLTGYSALTTYSYKLRCYYKQVVDNVLYRTNDYHSGEITDNTFTTLAAGAQPASRLSVGGITAVGGVH